MLYIAATLQAPDEVWMVGTGQEGATMTRLARFRMGRVMRAMDSRTLGPPTYPATSP